MELLLDYIKEDDWFYYLLVYDPQQKTLLADRGEIGVGDEYQADRVGDNPPVERKYCIVDVRNKKRTIYIATLFFKMLSPLIFRSEGGVNWRERNQKEENLGILH